MVAKTTYVHTQSCTRAISVKKLTNTGYTRTHKHIIIILKIQGNVRCAFMHALFIMDEANCSVYTMYLAHKM